MTNPPVGNVAQRAYDQLGPLARRDEQSGWLTLALTAALVAGDELPGLLVEDPGLREHLAVDVAPAEWLPLLANATGARLEASMSVLERREEVRAPAGRRRGRPSRVLEVVRGFLDEPRRAHLRERNDPDNAGDQPGHVTVQVRDSDLPDGAEPALTAAFLAALPVGLVGHVLITDNRTYDDVAAEFADYADVKASNDDYDDLLTPED